MRTDYRRRLYSPTERATIIGRALAVGPKQAAAETGVSRRTISDWLSKVDSIAEKGSGTVVAAVIATTREELADRLREGFALGIEATIAGLNDPHARLSDKARATEVLGESWRLVSGQATARTENASVNLTANLSPEDRDGMMDLLDAVLEERRVMALAGITHDGGPLTPEDRGALADLLNKVERQLAGGPAAVILGGGTDA